MKNFIAKIQGWWNSLTPKFKQLKENIKGWWNNLNPKTRQAVEIVSFTAGLVVVFFTLIYIGSV